MSLTIVLIADDALKTTPKFLGKHWKNWKSDEESKPFSS